MAKEYEKRNKNATYEVKEAYLTALFNFFVSGYYLDLKNKTYVAIGQTETYYKGYASENDWAMMDNYIKECINPEDQALITEVSRIEYIRQRLSKEENYSVEVRDHGTGTEKWYRFTVMRGADQDHAALSFIDVTDRVNQKQELEKLYEQQNELNSELEENQAQLEEANAEQESQIEEIKALNNQLEENQAELEAASAEQESQLDEINKLNEELSGQKDVLVKRLDAINSLSNVYLFSYYVDLDNDDYYELATQKNMNKYLEGYAPRGKAQAAINVITDNFVTPEYRDVMKAFTDYSTLSERMGKNKSIYQRYKSIKSGWVQAVYIAGDRHEDETLKSCTFVIRDVNAEVAEEEHQLKLMQVLSSDYVNVFLIDSKTGLSRAISLQQNISRVIEVEPQAVHSYEEAFEKYIKARVHPDEAKSVVSKMKLENVCKELKNKNEFSVNYKILADDEIHHYQFKYRKVPGTDDILLGFQNTDDIVNEISELNKSLAEYNNIMSSAGFGMWHIILKDGEEPRMTGNDKMLELMGVAGKKLSEQEMYNAWYDRIVPEAIPSVNASVAEMMEGKFSENTYLWNHPALGNIYVRCGGTCKKLEDGTNVLGGYHANVTDIVQKDKQREEALKKAQKAAEEERARVSEAYGMIEGFSREYHTIWLVNKETLKMQLIRSNGKSTVKKAVQMGIDYPDFDTAFNQYIETCIEPVDRERMHKEIAAAEILRQLEENPDKIYSVNYLRRDESGHVGYHQIAFANADTETGVKQFVYGFRDIDAIVKEEQKQKEEFKAAKEAAESANKAKTSFLFNMSHDIRTPMNAIMGFRDLLEKNQDNPEKRQDYLNKIRDSSTVLLSIINNVLEMARIEKGTIEIDEAAWSAEQFNDTLYSVFYEMMKEKGLKFTRQIEVQHHYVYCDPIKLREIFINILSNAYKYTHTGSVNMHLEEIPCDREGWALYRTTITDTGIGMDEDFIPHIFEEFSREHNTTEAKIEGTGLGMPIVKRLVQILDGKIEVHSKKGEGTTFIVTIPHRIAAKTELVRKQEIKVDQSVFKGKHILLAEDNDINAEIALVILTEAGFIPERAEDGEICVDMLKNSKPGYYDAILMDIQMPNMNGYEATRTIRAFNDKAKADIPIVAMTANAFEEDRREAIRAGMNGHVSKPINVNELMRTLAGLIK